MSSAEKAVMVIASILDFPRKQLTPDLWDYENPDDCPQLKPEARQFILDHAEKAANDHGVEIEEVRLYGGAASYQYAPGTDLDVSVTIKWPDGTTEEKVLELQDLFKNIPEVFYDQYPLHLFLKDPSESTEIADAIYSVTEDEWLLPPLVLPQGFDPDEYFAPMIKVAEKKAKKFDEWFGELRRSGATLKKSAQALETARDPEEVAKRIAEEKVKVQELLEKLAKEFIKVRENRTELHKKLTEKMEQDKTIGRFERFQEPEIIWKYLDRAGYNDLLWQIYKYVETT